MLPTVTDVTAARSAAVMRPADTALASALCRYGLADDSVIEVVDCGPALNSVFCQLYEASANSVTPVATS